jgi:hypothetical protein
VAAVSPGLTSGNGPLHAAYVNAVMSCIESMHKLLDVFLSIEPATVRFCPIIACVRASYSIVILIKLYISTFRHAIGSVLNRKELKVGYYIDACMDKLKIVAGPKKYRVAIKWLSILHEIKGWYLKCETKLNSKDGPTTEAKGIPDFGCPYPGVVSTSGRDPKESSGVLHLGFFEPASNAGSKVDVTAPNLPPNSLNSADQPWWTRTSGDALGGSHAVHPQMAPFDPFTMDFTTTEFSFLDQPGNGIDGNAMWTTESNVLGDENFDFSSGWGGAPFP